MVPAVIRGIDHRAVLHGGYGSDIGFQRKPAVFLHDLGDIAHRPGVVLGKILVEFLIGEPGNGRLFSAAGQQQADKQ